MRIPIWSLACLLQLREQLPEQMSPRLLRVLGQHLVTLSLQRPDLILQRRTHRAIPQSLIILLQPALLDIGGISLAARLIVVFVGVGQIAIKVLNHHPVTNCPFSLPFHLAEDIPIFSQQRIVSSAEDDESQVGWKVVDGIVVAVADKIGEESGRAVYEDVAVKERGEAGGRGRLVDS